jgi:hypothetical protein
MQGKARCVGRGEFTDADADADGDADACVRARPGGGLMSRRRGSVEWRDWAGPGLVKGWDGVGYVMQGG